MGRNRKIVFMTGDLGYKLFDGIAAQYPDRVINAGIREAAMVGIAAGLSKEGFLPLVYSIVPFVTLRCMEQIRVDLCYNNLPAVLVGVGSGLAYGANGPTHMGIEDVGAMGALPNMTILSPCDAVEVRTLLPQAVRLKSPVYLRLARSGEPTCHGESSGRPLKIGCPSVLQEGTDATVVTYGAMTGEVLRAARELEKEKGFSLRVVSWHTLKPFREEGMTELFRGDVPVMVIEEQMPGGGLGSRLALWMKTNAICAPLVHLHLPEAYPNICGDREYLLSLGGLSKRHIKDRIAQLLEREVK